MSESRILVAEDEESIRFVLKRALEARGYHVRPFAEGLAALAALRTGSFDLAIVDIRLPDISGLDLLSRARDEGLDVPFLVMTAESTMQNAIEAMKRGAFDYLTKPFDIEEIQLLVERALGLRRLSLMVENLKEEIRPQFTPGSGLVGKAPAMQEIYKTIGRVAGSDATVLLQGESGTGKELIARALHFHSGRSGPFVAINCSAIPRDLLESELFGHERGAFTGAVERVLGKFEVADKGTLFLDEISELPLELQAKLLRVLQEHEFVRLGAREPTRTDARIVSATNRDLADLVRKGKFREDLFFRLNVVPIVVPPLARSTRRYSRARPLLRSEDQPGDEGADQRPHSGRRSIARGASLAGQRPRARERVDPRLRDGGRPDAHRCGLPAHERSHDAARVDRGRRARRAREATVA